jgi:Family of unknown function (DUF6348)
MAAGDPQEWLSAVRREVARTLSTMLGAWTDDGASVIGPGTLAVRVVDTHQGGPRHVDLGFVLNRMRPDAPVIWDCVAGGSGDARDCAELACRIWAQTTAPAILELLTQRGEYADHATGDSIGLPGWHSIHGGILGYGKDDASPLQQWCLDHPIVPLLRHRLGLALGPGPLHGVKFLLGAFDEQSIAEVRIDGTRDEACSEELLALPWSKAGKRVVRFFVLFVHELDH